MLKFMPISRRHCHFLIPLIICKHIDLSTEASPHQPWRTMLMGRSSRNVGSRWAEVFRFNVGGCDSGVSIRLGHPDDDYIADMVPSSGMFQS